MKTAEELFDKYKTGYYGNEEFETKSLYIEEFILALTEYKSDIIKLIDEKRKLLADEWKEVMEADGHTGIYHNKLTKLSGQMEVLTELKQKTEEQK